MTLQINSHYTVIQFPTEDYNTGQSGLHGSSALNLTGTVQKTAASTTVTGTSTLFLSELVVGDSITVPGTANETRVIWTIPSDTSLTVDSNFANSAVGQTATVDAQGRFYAPAAGVYNCSTGLSTDNATTTTRELDLVKIGTGAFAVTQHQAASEIAVVTSDVKLATGEWVCSRFWTSIGTGVLAIQGISTFLSAHYVAPG